MIRNGMIALTSLVLLTGAVACKPKPETAAAPVIQSVEPTPTDIAPPPTPTIQEDEQAWMNEELARVTAEANARGLLGDIFFDFDRFELSADARERLAKNARFMMDAPQFVLTIEGHCDERGTNDYNLALGERRASAARDYLVSLGVSANRLRTISYGEERPFCSGSAESCWSQNRRGHFMVSSRTTDG
jgi:peptidoglycan-associated lipoprotein